MSSNNVPVSSSNDIPNISSNDNGVLVSPTATNTAHEDTDASLSQPQPQPLPIELPLAKYGYRTTRYEWSELCSIILVEHNLDKLCRSVDQQMEYELFKRELTKTWRTVLDYVLCTKLDVPRRVHAETGLAYAQLHPSPSPSSSSLPASSSSATVTETETDTTTVSTSTPLPSPKTIVVRNDFPYYTAENIHHYVLWKLHGICSDDDIAQAKEDVKHELEGGAVEDNENGHAVVVVVVDCLHWINPPHLKSLPDIEHVHILCLLQTSDNTVDVV
jgi:hypothetical protein